MSEKPPLNTPRTVSNAKTGSWLRATKNATGLRGERQTHDPAADSRPPSTARETGPTDDDRREDQFENEDIHVYKHCI
jgi:hypothetical protein